MHSERVRSDQAQTALAADRAVAYPFANLYAISTAPTATAVRAVNALKGRPLDQTGSLTTSREHIYRAWDWWRLPEGLSIAAVRRIVDAFFELGPFGFRGPAAAHVPDFLSSTDAGVRTAQVIGPGYRCPSNDVIGAAIEGLGSDYLYITSANRSRRLSGAADSPAHWSAEGLRADFGNTRDLLLLRHQDEAVARARYPLHLPMSTSILDLHRLAPSPPGDCRPHLSLQRHGSLAAEVVRDVLGELGFGLVLGPAAQSRLSLRRY